MIDSNLTPTGYGPRAFRASMGRVGAHASSRVRRWVQPPISDRPEADT